MLSRNILKVDDVFHIDGVGTIVSGILSSGSLSKGMKTIINGKSSEIIRIEARNQTLELLTAGLSAGLVLSNVSKQDIQKGSEYLFQ